MIRPCGRKLYLATKHRQTTCVFSSLQKAQTAGYDSITEIEPYFLHSSPICDKYVCLAKGSAVMLRTDGASPDTQQFTLGPLWGVNPQSAIAALCEAGEKRKNVLADALYLLEIDKEYTDDECPNLSRQQPFTALTSRIYDWEELPAEIQTADYIGRYFELKREAAEYHRLSTERLQRQSSSEMRFLSDTILNLLRHQAPDSDKSYLRTADPEIIRTQFTQALSYKFTQEEFIQLIAFLQTTPANMLFQPNQIESGVEAELLNTAYDTCLLELHILQNPHSKILRFLRKAD